MENGLVFYLYIINYNVTKLVIKMLNTIFFEEYNNANWR